MTKSTRKRVSPYWMGGSLLAISAAILAACADDPDGIVLPPPPPAPPPPPPVAMEPEVTLSSVGVFETGIFDEGAAEIVTFDPSSDRLFVVNSNDSTIDVLDLSDPASPTLISQIDATALGGGANSIAVSGGILAVAIEATTATDPGLVAFYDAATLSLDGQVTVGALPDMVTFTPDGQTVLVANEGEPSDDLTINPEGSISIIDVSGGAATATLEGTATFTSFNGMEDALNADGVRIFLPGATVAEDVEPEFIAVSADGTTAFVALQENNALAIVDIATATVTELVSFGTVDHSQAGFEFDPNDDDGINIVNGPVFGMRMPDAIASVEIDGETFIVTANEGDGREFETEDPMTGDDVEVFIEVVDVDDAVSDGLIDLTAFTTDELTALNDLEISNVSGDTDGDGMLEELFSFGARSFSIFAADGTLVFDSGSDFEMITAEEFPDDFNSNNDENDSFENRSDDGGPEPEGVAVGVVDGVTLAFIGLERIGGIMVYDISDPTAPVFEDYINIRDFTVDVQLPDDSVNPAVGDLGPEGLAFVSADDSPSGTPLLIVGNEVSGTTRIFEVGLEMVPVDS
ncbi:MAG: choice-of-anchor I family protein [Pseudomonadota bacterium]